MAYDPNTYTYKATGRYAIANGTTAIGNNSVHNNVYMTNEPPNHSITFHNTIDGEAVEVGKMDFNGGKFVFKGAADESAKVFMDAVSRMFHKRLIAERLAAAVVLKNLCDVNLEAGNERDAEYRKAFNDGVSTCRMILEMQLKEIESEAL